LVPEQGHGQLDKTQCITLIEAAWKAGVDLATFLEEQQQEMDFQVRNTITRMNNKVIEMIADGIRDHFIGLQKKDIVAASFSKFIDKQSRIDPK
jgi:hypothetical protein